MAVAWGLDRGVRLLARLGPPGGTTVPADPVEWDLRRQAAGVRLATLVARLADGRCPLDYRVLERFPPDDLDVARTVLGLRRSDGTAPWQTDAAMRRFLSVGGGSLLVVPEHDGIVAPVRFARVMMALDGSSRAECALPSALAIARRHAAELVLVHALPEQPLMVNGMPDARTLVLAEELDARNRRVADDYLAGIRARHAAAGVALRTHRLEPGDVRRRLLGAARTEAADLVVLATHGTGAHTDVPSGSVASFVIEHAPVPVLMIGTGTAPCGEPLYTDTGSAGLRRAVTVAERENGGAGANGRV